jgi:hypothetical protein
VTPLSRKLIVMNESIARTAQQTHVMRANYSKIAAKIKQEVAEDEMNARDTTQVTTGRGDKTNMNSTFDGSSPRRKSPRKNGGK